MPRKKIATRKRPRWKVGDSIKKKKLVVSPPFLDTGEPQENLSGAVPVSGDVEISLPDITEKPAYTPTAEEMEISLRKNLLVDMPTKLELKRGNAAGITKLIIWESRNHNAVENWRIVRKKLGMLTTLESIRPLGYQVDEGQLLKKGK